MLRNATVFRKGLFLISVPLLFQLAFGGLMWWQQHAEAEADEQDTRSKEILLQTQIVLSNLLEMQSAQRAYALSGDSFFLKSTPAIREQLLNGLSRFETLAAYSEDQALARRILNGAQQLFEMYQAKGSKPETGQEEELTVWIKTRQGQLLMDELRSDLNAFVQVQNSVAADRAAARERVHLRLRWLIAVMFLAAVGSSMFLALAFSRGISARVTTLIRNTQRLARGEVLIADRKRTIVAG